MKAKEIINLYEEDTITGREFYEQFESYFIKKMKSIGVNQVKEYCLTVRFIFDSESNFNSVKDFKGLIKIARKYGRALSKMIKNSIFISYTPGIRVEIFCDGKDLWDNNFSFLKIYCYAEGNKQINLDISLGYYVSQDILRNSNFIVSKTLLIDACAKVDEITKAIRLLSIGEKR